MLDYQSMKLLLVVCVMALVVVLALGACLFRFYMEASEDAYLDDTCMSSCDERWQSTHWLIRWAFYLFWPVLVIFLMINGDDEGDDDDFYL